MVERPARCHPVDAVIYRAAVAVGALSLALTLLALPNRALAWPPPMMEAGGATSSPDPFPAHEALQPAVRFWSDVFVHHDNDHVVLHDRSNMEIIWRVIELPRSDDGKVDEPAARELIKASSEDLKDRLRRLETNPTATDEEDRIILTLAGGHDAKRLKDAWTRVRAQRGVADRFRAGLIRARKWLPKIREILAKEGVPVEMAALPFVESMFNPKARSSAGAAGLWQLMPATARDLGLTVKRGNDERYDILKSSRAAAKMLKQNYRMLGSWPLAITAYNHGPYGMKRAVKAVGSTDLVYLIEHYEKSTWGFASKNFYAEFLAATQAFAEHEPAFAALINPESSKDGTKQLH